MKSFNLLLIAGLIAAAAAPARADAQQAQAKESRSQVPADSKPPKGMCRVWIDGVPAAQQPAATDCPSAIKNKPSNGRVLFGDDPNDSTNAKSADKAKLPPNIKGFTTVKPSAPVVVPKRPPDSR